MSARRWSVDRQQPSWPQLCVLTHHVIDGLAADATPSDAVDELKWAVARAGFAYPSPERFTAAVDAVLVAREKGYRTPLRRRV
jgi:hypothetical protein